MRRDGSTHERRILGRQGRQRVWEGRRGTQAGIPGGGVGSGHVRMERRPAPKCGIQADRMFLARAELRRMDRGEGCLTTEENRSCKAGRDATRIMLKPFS